MANWQSIVLEFMRNADPDGSFTHLANAGASAEAIEAAEAQIGVAIPDELRTFYQSFNGIGLGVCGENDSPRFIRPVEELSAFVTESRLWFAETHSNLASRFFPFIDWENGDVMGYMQQSDGTWHPFLVVFYHDHYRFDPAQDANEFLVQGPDSLREFLS